MITKIANEIAEATNAAPIWGRFAEVMPVYTSVSPTRNAIIVAESAIAPLISMGDKRFLSILC